MKRKIAIVLCLVLVAASFAGCSQAEIGYLNVNKEMGTQPFSATGSIEVKADLDALLDFLDKIETALDEDAVPMFSAEKGSTLALGTKTFKLNYDMRADMKNKVAFYMEFNVDFSGKNYDLGDIYVDAMDGMYVSKDTIIGIYDLYKAVFPTGNIEQFYSAEYRADLVKVLGNEEYIYISTMPGMSDAEKEELGLVPGMSSSMYESAVTFIEKAFAGFTTGAVKRISGGYEVSLDGKQIKTLISDVLLYLATNVEPVMQALSDYFTAIGENMNLPPDELVEMKAEMNSLLNSETRMFVAGVCMAAKQAVDDADKAGKLDFMNGLSYKSSVKKAGNKYIMDEEISIKDNAKFVVSMTSHGIVTMQDVEITMPKSYTSIEALDNELQALENKYNPVTNVYVSWWSADEGYAYISYERARANTFLSFSSDRGYAQAEVKNGSLYIPLRATAEAMGETIAWDQTAKKAYAIRNDKKIEMTGILVNGATLVKVRDFEKLGYTIDYTYDQKFGEHCVTITR